MAVATLTLLALLVALSALYMLRGPKSPKSSLPLPPGPLPLPVIGNAHQAPKSHPWFQYYEWAQQYGPVVHLNMLGQSVIILSSTQAAHDLLARRGAHFSDRPRLIVAGETALKGMHMLLRRYDDRFRLHQRLEAPVLSPRAAASYSELQSLEANQLLFDLLNNASGDSGIDCHDHFERATASVVYALFYGFRLQSASDPVLQAAHIVNKEFDHLAQVGAHLVDTFPVLDHLPDFLSPWRKKAEAHWGKQQALHVGNLHRGLEGDGWNFCKQMSQGLKDEGVDMTDDELALDVGIMADAAMDATTETLVFFIVACITEGESFVAKAQAHIDAVVGPKRLPGLEDAPQLRYIDAIIEEVLRWRPAGPAGVPHYTHIEGEYNGHRIPAKSVVIPNHWAITRETAVFGHEVEAFRPERWISEQDPGGALLSLPTVGFGYGRRLCPGRHVARNSLWVTIAQLLWAFDIGPGKSAAGQPITVDSMAMSDGLVAKALPFKATFKPRGMWAAELILRECDTSTVVLRNVLEKIESRFR